MVGVRWLVGDSDGQIGQRSRNEIQRGVRGFGENAQATGGYASTEFPATARFSARMAWGE